MRIPLENSIAGRCFTQSEPVIVQSDCEDKRVYRAVDQALEFRTCSLLAVPLIHGYQTIGVMEAVNKRDNSHYTEEDVTILETLASHAAAAIQFTRMIENAQVAYAGLAEVDRKKSNFVAATSHELRTPLGLILGHATVLKVSLENPFLLPI